MADRAAHAPRVALAALWAEGHLPRLPRLPARERPRGIAVPTATMEHPT